MAQNRNLMIVNGKDKTDSIASYHYKNGRCYITYGNSMKEYAYNSSNVQVVPLQKVINPTGLIITARGWQIPDATVLEDYGAWYRIIRANGMTKTYLKQEIVVQGDCLADADCKSLYDYFKQIAALVGLRTEEGQNILSLQYDKINQISKRTVLASYLNPEKKLKHWTPPETIIYPFGLNQSQKVAIEQAFSSQVSIIQGPPGTGKTQTILNIIANAVRNGKTVAVVSNNNSATMNVVEKLEKKGLSFLTAYLGSRANKDKFLASQSQRYPDMSNWKLPPEEKETLNQEVKQLSAEVNEMLDAKNRIAEIEQELLELTPEQHYFQEYYQSCPDTKLAASKLSSKKLLALWSEYENQSRQDEPLDFLKRVSIVFRYHFSALKLFRQSPEETIPYLQQQFYLKRQEELKAEKNQLEQKLEHYALDSKTAELTEKSLRLFRDEAANAYPWGLPRMQFEKADFRKKSDVFNKEYPVILSTTYSIKGTLSTEHLYDYLIIDEASQVDLATGVLAFSCARNVVIVGDQKQLPNVLNGEDRKAVEAVWAKHSFPKQYNYANHSLLSSAVEVWKEAPVTLLREHYRCHPKIINFCNQKFYDGKLIVMTEDHGEEDALTLFRTSVGNHARDHVNQRQIDVIQTEVLPRLQQKGYQDIGIITPYCDQVDAVRKQLNGAYEVDTVHKFQGREKEAIILTSVDNVITGFVDDPCMLNVAVSRAVKALVVVTSQNPKNDKTNYGDLARYITYQNCEVIDSAVYSVFDLLYQNYRQERMAYLKKHKRVSEYDSENLMYSVIEEILATPEFSGIDCAVRVSLSNLIRNYDLLDDDERRYARNPLTHTDFLLFHRMDKTPIMAIEVDGTAFHKEGSRQAERDDMKNCIFKKCGLPLLRIRTDESGEREKIHEMLRKALMANAPKEA